MAKKRDHADIFKKLEETKVEETETQEYNSDKLRENPRLILEEEYKEKYNTAKNKSVTHTRRTFLIDNEVSERLNKLSAGKHGFKTEFVNKAIELLLTYYDEDQEG